MQTVNVSTITNISPLGVDPTDKDSRIDARKLKGIDASLHSFGSFGNASFGDWASFNDDCFGNDIKDEKNESKRKGKSSHHNSCQPDIVRSQRSLSTRRNENQTRQRKSSQSQPKKGKASNKSRKLTNVTQLRRNHSSSSSSSSSSSHSSPSNLPTKKKNEGKKKSRGKLLENNEEIRKLSNHRIRSWYCSSGDEFDQDIDKTQKCYEDEKPTVPLDINNRRDRFKIDNETNDVPLNEKMYVKDQKPFIISNSVVQKQRPSASSRRLKSLTRKSKSMDARRMEINALKEDGVPDQIRIPETDSNKDDTKGKISRKFNVSKRRASMGCTPREVHRDNYYRNKTRHSESSKEQRKSSNTSDAKMMLPKRSYSLGFNSNHGSLVRKSVGRNNSIGFDTEYDRRDRNSRDNQNDRKHHPNESRKSDGRKKRVVKDDTKSLEAEFKEFLRRT